MINIAICDDEPAEVAYLNALAREWAAERRTPIKTAAFANAEHFIVGGEITPDIILLDIQMGGMDGMNLARHIRKGNASMQIIFITGYADYIADGYEVDALHYLMKPVEKERLFAVLDKAAERLEKEEETLAVQTNDGTARVRVGDIRCIEAFAHYVHIKYKNETIETRAKISDLEDALGEAFVRCHRSYLVGLRHVHRITKNDVVLEGGESVPLSRRVYNEVNRAFIKYYTNSE
ncbi:MAG: LytTR family DNA-binding domain-containing protein [Defluviitaleaceae bacterium]|nr:LytTR family DNA-binding domain-containing protein [Defluviitaleaceae bacterium]